MHFLHSEDLSCRLASHPPHLTETAFADDVVETEVGLLNDSGVGVEGKSTIPHLYLETLEMMPGGWFCTVQTGNHLALIDLRGFEL